MTSSTALSVHWNKCQGEQWCNLFRVNLEDQHFANLEGVYVIWHGGHSPATVRVGQGIVKDRLAEHRRDPAILQHQPHGVFVTWAQIGAYQRDGVEKYLGDTLKPKMGTHFPDTHVIVVNLPW